MHIIKCALQASDIWTKTRPQHWELHALLFTMSVWVLQCPLLAITVKMQETWPTVYRPYARRLEYLTIAKAAYSHILLSYFKTLSVGPVWGSNPRPPAR